jgi:hypothetical protein
MTEQFRDEIKRAIEYAIADLLEISENSPHEVLPKEGQFRSAMYAYFKHKGYTAHVEADYPGTRKECDLRVRWGPHEEAWIEVKTVWHAKGWVNKPGLSRLWEDDVPRLKMAPENALRVFVLRGFFDHDPAKRKTSVSERIQGFHPDKRIYDSGARDFHWPNSPISKLQAWAWLL